jgi:16S rRNA (uracil1498-N3)-methyltransferase
MSNFRAFLLPEAELGADYAILEARESHHLVRVFRAKAGDQIELLDGLGARYLGSIEDANAKGVRISIAKKEIEAARQPQVTLVQAVPKGKAMDLILRMATELGAAAVQPIFTAQGEVQLSGERLESKCEKWRLGMVEACKQCGLAWLPELRTPMSFEAWQKSRETLEAAPLRLLASLEAGSPALIDRLREATIPSSGIEVLVGPEGDFSVEEYRVLKSIKSQSVRLGSNVLRAETAAAYILSVVDQVTTV